MGDGEGGGAGGAGAHRPRVMCLLSRLASSPLGGLHGLEDAAVGVSGLDGPLDEVVLVDSTDDAVCGQERNMGCGGQGPGAQASSGSPAITAAGPTGLPTPAPSPLPLPCCPPGMPFFF